MPKQNWQSRYRSASLSLHLFDPEDRSQRNIKLALRQLNAAVCDINYDALEEDATALRHACSADVGAALLGLLRIAQVVGIDVEDDGEVALTTLEALVRQRAQAVPTQGQRAPTLGDLGGTYN